MKKLLTTVVTGVVIILLADVAREKLRAKAAI